MAKLQSIITSQSQQSGQKDQSLHNPYVDAWYRKENAAKEFENYPPKVSVCIKHSLGLEWNVLLEDMGLTFHDVAIVNNSTGTLFNLSGSKPRLLGRWP